MPIMHQNHVGLYLRKGLHILEKKGQNYSHCLRINNSFKYSLTEIFSCGSVFNT